MIKVKTIFPNICFVTLHSFHTTWLPVPQPDEEETKIINEGRCKLLNDITALIILVELLCSLTGIMRKKSSRFSQGAVKTGSTPCHVLT